MRRSEEEGEAEVEEEEEEGSLACSTGSHKAEGETGTE